MIAAAVGRVAWFVGGPRPPCREARGATGGSLTYREAMTDHVPGGTSGRRVGRGEPPLRLRDMRVTDLPATARLHRTLLPNGLFPLLGQRFVQRWHRTFLSSPDAVAQVVTDEKDTVVAFLLATTDQRRYLAGTLRDHRLTLMALGCVGLLRRPRLLVRFVRTRLRSYWRHLSPLSAPRQRSGRRGPAPTGRPDTDWEVVGVVHAVVTDHPARRRGCAAAMLAVVQERALAAGSDHLALVTDLDGSAAMYERLGWRRVGVRRHRDGRDIAEYRLVPAARGIDLRQTDAQAAERSKERTEESAAQ